MNCECGELSKYKCPRCRVPYCSKECYSLHKQTNCERKRSTKFEPLVKHPPRNFLLDDEDEIILSDNELDQMRLNPNISRILQNSQLRKVLTEIDHSDNRLGALRSILMQDKTGQGLLTQLVDEILKSLGYIDEKGQSNI